MPNGVQPAPRHAAGGVNAGRRRALIATGLLLQGHVPAARAAEVSVDVVREPDAMRLLATALIDAGRDVAWQVLTDYPRYPAFIPDITRCRVVDRNGAVVVVEQDGNASLGPLRFPLSVRYEIVEAPPEDLRSRGTIVDHGVIESRYVLRAQGERVQIDYAGTLRVDSRAPGPLEEAVGRSTFFRQFGALVAEIERVAAARRAGAPA